MTLLPTLLLHAMDDVYIHPSSIVDPGAQIGAGTKIWHFCHIMHGVQMGQNCSVGQNVFIASGVVLGNRVKIQNNVSVYAGVICEDDVFLGPSCVFTNVNNPRSHVVRKSEYKPTLLKKGVTIGANATILCGITIGAYAFIGAGTVVLHDVPDYALMVGNPAKQIGWMSRDGYRLYFLKNIAFCAEENAYYKIENNQVRYLGNQNI